MLRDQALQPHPACRVRGAIQPKPTPPTSPSQYDPRRIIKPAVYNFGLTRKCLAGSAGDGIKLIVSQDRHVVIAVRRLVLSGDFVLSGSLLRHGLLPGEGADDSISASPRLWCTAQAALWHDRRLFVLVGEAVLLGVDGVSDFNGLHSRKHDDEVMFYAFDILVSDGEDLRMLPLHLRKNNLARLLAKRINGIFLADFEQGEIGPDLFRHACLMGLEGLVSKHKDRPYRAGRSPHWVKVKVKNRKHPAMSRVMDTFSWRLSAYQRLPK
jgi:bifunctional non-homologous end joining protein LigD